YFIYPMNNPNVSIGLPNKFGYVMYVIFALFIFLIFYNNKRNKQYLTKYYYFYAYVILSFVNDLITYWDEPNSFSSGNAVELFLVLFSPIFVNKKYFWTVSIGLTVKYLVSGLILGTTMVGLPIVLIIFLGIVAYILLTRFYGYVNALSVAYDQQMVGIVKGVIAALELKDPYTRGHSERVAKYAVVLAKELGSFSHDELKSFNYACLLHDIGKVNIPDSILMKPAKLTD